MRCLGVRSLGLVNKKSWVSAPIKALVMLGRASTLGFHYRMDFFIRPMELVTHECEL